MINFDFDTTGFKKVNVISFHGVTFESNGDITVYYNKSEQRVVFELYNKYEKTYEYNEMYFGKFGLKKKFIGKCNKSIFR